MFQNSATAPAMKLLSNMIKNETSTKNDFMHGDIFHLQLMQ